MPPELLMALQKLHDVTQNYKESAQVVQDARAEVVRAVTEFVRNDGMAALRSEAQLMSAMVRANVPAKEIASVTKAFSRVRSVVQPVQQAGGTQAGQQLMRQGVELLQRAAGGAQNVGRFLLQEGVKLGAGVGGAIAGGAANVGSGLAWIGGIVATPEAAALAMAVAALIVTLAAVYAIIWACGLHRQPKRLQDPIFNGTPGGSSMRLGNVF